MSKRFGRNQRRRAREQIAAAEAAARKWEAVSDTRLQTVAEIRREMNDLRHGVEEIAGRVGQYAISAGVVPQFQANWFRRGMPNFMVTVLERIQSFAHYANEAAIDSCMRQEIMRLLEVEVVESQMNRDMHCRVTFDGHLVGYALSAHAVATLSREEIVRRIAPEIARLLAWELKK